MDTTAGEKVHCERKWASLYMVTGSNGNKGMANVARSIKVFVSFERSPKAYRLYPSVYSGYPFEMIAVVCRVKRMTCRLILKAYRASYECL
jgi:hypothetical protein